MIEYNWYTTGNANAPHFQCGVADEQTGRTVAVTYDDEGGHKATLMAAAPDLLKALDECITDDGAACIVQNDVAYMIRRFKAINRIARAAIANATYRPDYHDLDRVPYGC